MIVHAITGHAHGHRVGHFGVCVWGGVFDYYLRNPMKTLSRPSSMLEVKCILSLINFKF